MAPPTSTFATLRALLLVISDALDDIQRVFSQNSLSDSPASQCSSPVYLNSPDLSPAVSPFPATPPTSFPPTPLSATFPSLRSPPHDDVGVPFVDYPSPDLPFVSGSPSEQLALHPDAVAAASRIVAACGQMSSIVHKPFSSLCDAIMGYNLPACMRLVEHLHIAEILREAEENRQRFLSTGQGPTVPLPARVANAVSSALAASALTPDAVDARSLVDGMEWRPVSRAYRGTGLHVADITNVICSYAGDGYVDPNELVHVLRLLSTHHIFRETSPDTFALTRIASLLDSGKTVEAIFSNPETKYDDTDGTPAFVALCTDELFKSAAYLTEAFTGVQLPTSASPPAANTILPGTTTISSIYATNDSTPCAPTTRSSSVLTHIVYPEDENAQPVSHSLPFAGSPEHIRLLPLTTNNLTPPQPLPTEPRVPLSCLSPAETSTQGGKWRSQSGDATGSEKLLAFNLAFHTKAPFFEWLENGGEDLLGGTGRGACICAPTKMGNIMQGDVQAVPDNGPSCVVEKPFRLQRFSNAMMGTAGWEAPKAILSGFDWFALPNGSTIVDVGGGIGSTTMVLARALNDTRAASVKKHDVHEEDATTPRHTDMPPNGPSSIVSDESRSNTPSKDNVNFRFIVQDRPVVTALGIQAWRSKCPEMLESGQVIFQDQDFFEPQLPLELPHLSRHPAVYLLRVVLHDWPDEFARRILINLRVASSLKTRLLIAEHVLPLACADDNVSDHMNTEACEASKTAEWTVSSVLARVEGAERTLVPPPLLSNLGKASANAYWMDLTMHVTLNGKERTLREFCALALSAGWRVMRMSRPEGSLFAYLICEPIALPDDAQAIYNAVVLSSELSTVVAVPPEFPDHHSLAEASRYKRLPAVPLLPSPVLERSSSRCGTPTFGSRMLLPKDEELQSPRTRGARVAKKWLKSKGLGVRGVMMQKAEKQREQNLSQSVSLRANSDTQNAGPVSSSHVRVWWKKSPPNSTSNSSAAIHELSDEVPSQQTTGQGRSGTLQFNNSSSTPSPRISPAHQKWPSTESTASPISQVSPQVSQARRPSVASITRKLSFATFRRPSIADITEPSPMPPLSAAPTKLAPSPTLHGGAGRSLKHLPSLPTLGGGKVTAAGQSTIPRRPSLGFVGHVPSPRPVSKSAPSRRHNIADSPKPGILKSRSGLHTSNQVPPDTARPTESTSTFIPRRQRRVTLSNSPVPPQRVQAPTPGNVGVSPGPTASAAKRTSSVPKMSHRLSIPMLRRKQSRSVIEDAESGG